MAGSLLLLLVAVVSATAVTAQQAIPPYVKQCHSSDPQILDCIINSLKHLRPWLATGIPEIKMPSVEPFTIDLLSLSLGNGPSGYKIMLKHVDVFGASNFTVSKLKLSENGRPFEARVRMPHLKIKAKYSSSGMLLIIPSSGNGTFYSTFDGVTADIKGKVSKKEKGDGQYLHVDSLEVELHVKTVLMSVRKIFNNNRVLIEAINLFLRENGQEILRAMMPQLREQLAIVFKRVVNQLTENVPIHVYYVQD